jgi:hypothetical protein
MRCQVFFFAHHRFAVASRLPPRTPAGIGAGNPQFKIDKVNSNNVTLNMK